MGQRQHGEQGESLSVGGTGVAEDGDFELPDFLDLVGDWPDVDFGVATTARGADGGILVFPGAVLVIDGARHERLPFERIRGWRIHDETASFTVTVLCGDGAVHRACLPAAFRAPTVSALEEALGPAENPL